MAPSDKAAVLAALAQKITKLERTAPIVGQPRASRFQFGLDAVDRLLMNQQFPYGALHEIQGDTGIADFTAANGFVAGIAANLTGGILWCVGRSQIYGPAIASLGLSPSRIIFAHAKNDDEALAVMEEGLRHASLAAVIGEVKRVSLNASRRLILAAEKSGVAAFVLRPPVHQSKPERVACATRWRIGAAPSAPLPVQGVGRARWSVELLRARGGATGQWIIEAPDASGHFRLSQTLAGGAQVTSLEAWRLEFQRLAAG
jgi:protein ImuA